MYMYHGTLLLYFTHTLVPVYRWYTCVHTYIYVPPMWSFMWMCTVGGTFFGFNFLLRGFKRVLCKYTFLNLPGLRSQIVHSNRLSNYFCFCIDIIDTVLMMVVLVQKCSEVGIGLTFLSQEIFCQDPGGRTGDDLSRDKNCPVHLWHAIDLQYKSMLRNRREKALLKLKYLFLL